MTKKPSLSLETRRNVRYFFDQFFFLFPQAHYIMWSCVIKERRKRYMMEIKIASRTCPDELGRSRTFHYSLNDPSGGARRGSRLSAGCGGGLAVMFLWPLGFSRMCRSLSFSGCRKVLGLFRQPEKCRYFCAAQRRKSPRSARRGPCTAGPPRHSIPFEAGGCPLELPRPNPDRFYPTEPFQQAEKS